MHVDVAIIGGGPAGSTLGTLLKKYNPALKVAIFEREVFPRDHVGESQLPGISVVLDEMGVWDKVEAANFPIKLGGTYKWGKSPELWDVEFYPAKQFKDEERPAKYQGQRRATAFQVDRSIYDEILLDHAAECGCDVREGTRVLEINREGDRITDLRLESGETVEARYYVDASGHSGILRRAMDVHAEYPTSLQNIAIWEYWQNADWAVEIGVGGTYIQVISVGYGWIWFIPLGPTRTSIGLVVPAEYYKNSGRKPQELYREALQADERIAGLMRNAESEGKLYTTKDWSFLSSRQQGANWFLVGESAGFADPILSAGLTMAHVSAKELAYTILELDRGQLPAQWLKEKFESRQSLRIQNHIRFGDYWYTANSQMKDLKEFTSKIASDAGLDLEPEKAWTWLARGGFINDDLNIGTGSFSIDALKALGVYLTDVKVESPFAKNNVFRLNLDGAVKTDRPRYVEGQVKQIPAYEKDGKVLPLDVPFPLLIDILQREVLLPRIVQRLRHWGQGFGENEALKNHHIIMAIRGLEAMVHDGWIEASYDPNIDLVDLSMEYGAIHKNEYAMV